MISVAEYVKIADEANCYTPDLTALQTRYTKLPVFIYNAMKQGFSNSTWLNQKYLVGPARTVRNEWVLYTTDKHEPIAFLTHDENICGHLQGMLYQLPVSVLIDLDRELMNTIFFMRSWHYVTYTPNEGNSSSTLSCSAFIHRGDPVTWKHKMTELKRIPRLAHNDKFHYLFSNFDDIPNTLQKVRQCM